VYRVVWEPLLKGKFGDDVAPRISAVWFWNKLKLRGGSRGKGGAECSRTTRAASRRWRPGGRRGARARRGDPTQHPRHRPVVEDGRVTGVETSDGVIAADQVLATPALPVVADMVEPYVTPEYAASLRRIEYLANVCLVLQLDRSLSDTYWLNVNDPGFPFVAVIEHTNFEPPETYGGRRIVYLSKYLPESHPMFQMDDAEMLRFAVPHIKRMFPKFEESWILDYHVWRATHSQPIVVKRYSELIPTCALRSRGCTWRRWRRSTPRTAAPTTRSARGARPGG
jgi:protoporphyrinogen oxidase